MARSEDDDPIHSPFDDGLSEQVSGGSESGADSGQSIKISGEVNPPIKPSSSKPTPKAVSKPPISNPSESSSPPPPVGSKRKQPAPVPETESKSKKAKQSGDDTFTEAKKTSGDDPKSRRLWSEEDEVAILKGIRIFTAKNKGDPIAEKNAFHDFVRKTLHADVTTTQLYDKVRRLKRKYMEMCKKEKNGKEITFSKPHDQLCYKLSKKIWGSSNGSEDANAKIDNLKGSRSGKNGSILIPSDVDEADGVHKEVIGMEVDADVRSVGAVGLVLSGGSVGLCDSVDQVIKNGWKLVAGSKKSAWEKKSKKLMVEEFDLYVKRLELKHEQVKLVLEAMKSA